MDWVFGYGSLIWRPSFAHIERRPAVLAGWSRRFWQGSTDHRGVPGAPGRVVTLIEEAQERCWGMAFRLDPNQRDAVLAELDHREKGGYERRVVDLELDGGEGESLSHAPRDIARAEALVYVAAVHNENYLGPAPLEDIARQVAGANGPSGANREYVLRLAEALREHGAFDRHVFELEALLVPARGDLQGESRKPAGDEQEGRG